MTKVDVKQTGLYVFVLSMIALEILAGLIGFFVFILDDPAIAFIFIGSAIVAVFLLTGYFNIAVHFYQAAIDKGYTDRYYLNLAFFFPFAGYALVNALPDRGNVTVEPQATVETDDLPEL